MTLVRRRVVPRRSPDAGQHSIASVLSRLVAIMCVLLHGAPSFAWCAAYCCSAALLLCCFASLLLCCCAGVCCSAAVLLGCPAAALLSLVCAAICLRVTDNPVLTRDSTMVSVLECLTGMPPKVLAVVPVAEVPGEAKGTATAKTKAKGRGRGRGRCKAVATEAKSSAQPNKAKLTVKVEIAKDGNAIVASNAAPESHNEEVAAPASHNENGAAVKPHEPLATEVRKRTWAEYIRTLNPALERGSRSRKCPHDILCKLHSLADRQQYFKIWIEHGGDWAKVELAEEHAHTEKKTAATVMAWLTEDQMADLYTSKVVVAELKKAKLEHASTWRQHPELPHLPEANQYKCMLTEKEKKEVEDSWQNNDAFGDPS